MQQEPSETKCKPIDLVIVGAGWAGLAMARTYLEVNPHEEVVLLDSSHTVGGVWAKEKLYKDLRTNNIAGFFEYSDWPMKAETYGVKVGEHIPGETIHQYLYDFAENFDLLRRIEFDSQVKKVEQKWDDTWLLEISRYGHSIDRPATIWAKRLVIATGVTSDPYMPQLNGASSFGSPLFHSGELPRYQDVYLPAEKKVVVLGGSKGAWDVVYAYASMGMEVEWVIRPDGNGPNWMATAHVGPGKKIAAGYALFIRIFTWLSPSMWGDADGYGRVRSWIHGTWLGSWIIHLLFRILTYNIIRANRYDDHPETKKLKPWLDIFWVGTMRGILNYPTDIFDLIRKRVKVHMASVESLSPRSVHLSTGETLSNVDLFCCATGWRHQLNLQFFNGDTDLRQSLGLPHYSTDTDAVTAEADATILEKFKTLRHQPKLVREKASTTRTNNEAVEETANEHRYNLFRFMLPPNYRSKQNIAFAGLVLSVSAAMIAQTQALWITAYFAGKLHWLPPLVKKPTGSKSIQEDVEWQAVLENRFIRWRYRDGIDGRFAHFFAESLSYIDLLLRDIGLRRWRKQSRLAEITMPYMPIDYSGLIDEWKAAYMTK